MVTKSVNLVFYVAQEINNVLFTSLCVFIVIWMFSGYDLLPAMNTLGFDTELLERVIVAIELHNSDTIECYSRIDYVGNNADEDSKILNDCILSRALDVQGESYIVPLLMEWMKIDRTQAENITTYFYETLVDTDVYYGEG